MAMRLSRRPSSYLKEFHLEDVQGRRQIHVHFSSLKLPSAIVYDNLPRGTNWDRLLDCSRIDKQVRSFRSRVECM